VVLDYTIEKAPSDFEEVLSMGDVTGGVAICLNFIKLKPNRVTSYRFLVSRFRKMKLFGQAKLILQQGRKHCSNDETLAIDNAWIAHERGDFGEAMGLWNVIRSDFPDNVFGYTGAVATLREAGNFSGELALIETAIARFPDDANPQIERAYLAHALGDIQEAVLRWEMIRQFFPHQPAGYVGGAVALRAAGRGEEASLVLQQWDDLLRSEADSLTGC
jgi:tetratricopeptide (TPR) repeat protein